MLLSLVWEPRYTESAIDDGPFVGLTEGYRQIVLAFQDWLNILLTHGKCGSYHEDESSILTAFGKALTNGFNRTAFTESRFEYGIKKLLSFLITNLPIGLGIESLEPQLQVAAELPEIKNNLYDNPNQRYLTRIDEWKILCVQKTDPETAHAHHAIWTMARGNTFFITQSGFMGTGPALMKSDDIVVLIPGVRMPMIFRVAPKGQKLVSPAYIHGLMERELWDEDERNLAIATII